MELEGFPKVCDVFRQEVVPFLDALQMKGNLRGARA